MAKKQTFNFSDISKLLKTSIEKTSVKIVDKEDGEFISTGIYILDALLSSYILNGGIQSNRITAFAGESATGKSYLCYNIAREAQKKG
jgi:RecA/RadA recombinase